jgi:hypothetical protein
MDLYVYCNICNVLVALDQANDIQLFKEKTASNNGVGIWFNLVYMYVCVCVCVCVYVCVCMYMYVCMHACM